jgi:Zn-dependent protease with chaperone function
MTNLHRAKLAAVIAVTILALACATRQPGDPISPGYNTYSVDQDIAIGKEAAAEIRKQADVVNDQRLQSYINAVGQRLAKQPEARDYPYSFTLINEPSINAFALPGGPIFVHAPLFNATSSEAELAGVLAHEISHVALRHGTSQASKAQMVQLPAILAGAAIGQENVVAQLGQLGLGLGVNSLIMKYSRSAETEADALGVRIMSGAGYDPVAMARFFQKLEAEGGPRPPTFLSSHPNPGNRMQAVQAEVARLPPAQYGYSSGDFDQAQRLVAQLPPPKNQPSSTTATALSPASNAPAGAVATFDAGRYSVSHPSNWEVFGSRNSAAVTIAPSQGLVRIPGGGTGIAYGTVLSYYKPQSSRNLRQATGELVRELQSANPSMRATGPSRSVQVNGSPGLVTTFSARSPQGGVERDVLLTVARPEGIFYMILVGPESSFAQLEPAFQKMLDSIQFRG